MQNYFLLKILFAALGHIRVYDFSEIGTFSANTPKYGLLFHSSFIGKAGTKNKGRVSRYLANKCSIAARVDCFSETPVSTYGEFLRQQVEDRLEYFTSGTVPKKNIDVMKEAEEAAVEVKEKVQFCANFLFSMYLMRANCFNSAV